MTFQPGQSGNPQGRKREDVRVKELARQYTDVAIQALVKALDSDKAVQAAVALLDRGYGKPAQELTGPDGSRLFENITINFVRAEPPPKPEEPYHIGGSPLDIKFR